MGGWVQKQARKNARIHVSMMSVLCRAAQRTCMLQQATAQLVTPLKLNALPPLQIASNPTNSLPTTYLADAVCLVHHHTRQAPICPKCIECAHQGVRLCNLFRSDVQQPGARGSRGQPGFVGCFGGGKGRRFQICVCADSCACRHNKRRSRHAELQDASAPTRTVPTLDPYTQPHTTTTHPPSPVQYHALLLPVLLSCQRLCRHISLP